MNAKVMLDTNILVYAYDRSEPGKQKIATQLVNDLVSLKAGSITTQVLGEFFVTVTGKIPAPLSTKQAGERVHRFCQIWPVYEVNEMIVSETIRGVLQHQLSYWDAQLWATARLNQVGLLFSEDFSHDSIVDGVRFINPFLAEFELNQILRRPN